MIASHNQLIKALINLLMNLLLIKSNYQSTSDDSEYFDSACLRSLGRHQTSASFSNTIPLEIDLIGTNDTDSALLLEELRPQYNSEDQMTFD